MNGRQPVANDERDELAELIYGETANPEDQRPTVAIDQTAAMALAVEIRAAGYRKPRTVTTAEELDALPVWSVVLSNTYDWAVWKLDADGWRGTNHDFCANGGELTLTYGRDFTVLHIGGIE